MGLTLGDLLSLEDLADLLVEHLVTLLADLDDLGTLSTPSCKSRTMMISSMLLVFFPCVQPARSTRCNADLHFAGRPILTKSIRCNAPETAARTFCEISAAVLYLVRVSGLARV